MTVYNPTGTYGNIVIGPASSSASHTISIAGASSTGAVLTAAGTSNTWTNVARTTAKGQLHLEGDDADLVINGVKLSDTLKAINDRLSILQPDPKLLEKYNNLREAYEHYQTLEALLYEDKDNLKR